jgi:hypothetical protein
MQEMVISMRYIIYRITNNINGRYYIGRHATKNIDDNYMGSGKAIRNAIKKYGNESFFKEIIAEAGSAEELWELERQIVNESVVKDPLSYNMTYGGKSYLDGLKKYNPKQFRQHQSDAGKIGGVNVHKTRTPEQVKEWHSSGGKAGAIKQRLSGSHPFYTGEAASAGGKAIKGMLELWDPNSIATNKNQKEYRSGDCKRAKIGSVQYTNLIDQGWLPIEQHKQKMQSLVI